MQFVQQVKNASLREDPNKVGRVKTFVFKELLVVTSLKGT